MLAAGFTSDEGGGISYNVPYAKSVSLEKTLIDSDFLDSELGSPAYHLRVWSPLLCDVFFLRNNETLLLS